MHLKWKGPVTGRTVNRPLISNYQAAFNTPNLSEITAKRQALFLAARHRARHALALLASIIFGSHATRAFVEYVGARPGEGAVGAFAFGRSKGAIEGVLCACGVPCAFLTPASWKRAVGLTLGSKDAARAEAALIAVAGIMRQGAAI